MVRNLVARNLCTPVQTTCCLLATCYYQKSGQSALSLSTTFNGYALEHDVEGSEVNQSRSHIRLVFNRADGQCGLGPSVLQTYETFVDIQNARPLSQVDNINTGTTHT